jgi:hypothetical protein
MFYTGFEFGLGFVAAIAATIAAIRFLVWWIPAYRNMREAPLGQALLAWLGGCVVAGAAAASIIALDVWLNIPPH